MAELSPTAAGTGAALRRAYRCDSSEPPEIVALLRLLDRKTGGAGKSLRSDSAVTERPHEFPRVQIKIQPPTNGEPPMLGNRERGTCEACGAAFTSDRMNLRQYPRWSPKRFCSESCRKREEARRYRARKAAANA